MKIKITVGGFDIRPIFGWLLIAVVSGAVVSLLVSLQAGLLILFFLSVAWWVWENTEEGFLLLIILAPLLPMLKITQTIGTVTLIKDVIILTLFVRLVGWPLIKKRLPYRRNILLAPIGALILWTAFEMLRADSIILGILRARDIGLFIFLYWAVLYLKHDRERMIMRLKWLWGGVIILLILAVYQWFWAVDSAVLRFDPIRNVWIPRLSSIMAHPSIFGQYLVSVAALASAIFIGNRNNRVRWFVAALFIVILPFIWLTYSRAVWIGLVMVMLVVSTALTVRWATGRIVKKRLMSYGLSALLVVLVVALAVGKYTPVGVYVRSAIDPTYGSNEERLEFAVRLIAPLTNTEAILGKGLGDVLAQNFRSVDLEIFDVASGNARSVQLTKNRTLVDNQYLKTFIEMGMIGILIYGWIYWRIGKYSWSLTRLGESRAGDVAIKSVLNRIVGYWGLGFLAAFVVQAFFIDIWDIFPTNMLFWIVGAFVSARSVNLDPTQD